MDIVHVSIGALPRVFTTQGGAIQRRVAELALAQARAGHRVTVYSPAERAGTREVEGIRVHDVRLRLPHPPAYLEYQVRVTADMRRRGAPDVIHFHSEPEGAVSSVPLRSPTVLTYDNYFFRGGPPRPLHTPYRHAMLRFDALLPCSRYCAESSTAYWDLPPDRVEIVPNGVNVSQFRPDPEAAAAERERLAIPGPVVLYLGRVCEQKGSDTLLDAWAAVRASHPDAELVIAGPLEQFTSAAAPADWPARMRSAGATYLGQVEDSRLRGLLNLADVFVMPTRRLEMFGMAAVEALACGTPVVASDHGGLPETVPAGTGRLFAPGDPAALATALNAMLDDPELRARAGEQAREHAQVYAWERVCEQLDAVYAAAAARSGGRRRSPHIRR